MALGLGSQIGSTWMRQPNAVMTLYTSPIVGGSTAARSAVFNNWIFGTTAAGGVSIVVLLDAFPPQLVHPHHLFGRLG